MNEYKRNLTADLAICEAATAGPWFKTDGIHALYVSTDACMDVIAECEVVRDAVFIAEARTGWPHAIQRAMAAEMEVERLRDVLNRIAGATASMFYPSAEIATWMRRQAINALEAEVPTDAEN